MGTNTPIYRPNVAAIIRRSDHKILVGERSDRPGSWQFPQGGIKPRETPEQALERELLEEVGLPGGSYRIIERTEPYRYLFDGGRTKEGFHGQEQIYFLIELLPGFEPKHETGEPEFRALNWIVPSEFNIEWVPPFKREVYRRVLSLFFGVQTFVGEERGVME
ncbi:MAG TPA: NUDIX domain-containing protein [Chthoniobacterales bacterium]